MSVSPDAEEEASTEIRTMIDMTTTSRSNVGLSIRSIGM